MELKLDSFREIKMSHAWIFALLLFAMQLITGTILDYALLVMAFVIFTAAAVNSAGGPLAVGGFGIGMIGLKVVIISQLAKVMFGQPGNSYLDVPIKTIGILTLGMGAIYMAGLSVNKFAKVDKVMKRIEDTEGLLGLSVLVYVLGLGSYLYVMFHGYDQSLGDISVGGIVGLLRQIGFIYPLATICAIAYTLKVSGGTRSVSLWAMVTLFTQFAFGILATSKQMMFEPFLLYLLTCLAFGYRFKLRHVLSISLVSLIMVLVLFPFAQIGRVLTRDNDPSQNVALTKLFIGQIFMKRENLEEVEVFIEEAADKHQRFYYYGKNTGLLDRMSLIEQNDELFRAVEEQGYSGWHTISHGFRMLPPRFLYADKPVYNTANYFGHKIEMISENDYTTQISMGIIAEAYDAFGWIGTLVIPYLTLAAFILVYNSLSGSLKANIWAVFLINIFQHNLVEATISSLTLYIFQFPVLLLSLYFILTIVVNKTLPFWRHIAVIWPFSSSLSGART